MCSEVDNYCWDCSGTGISSSGPVDSSCSTCSGSGIEKDSNENDWGPDEDPFYD